MRIFYLKYRKVKFTED